MHRRHEQLSLRMALAAATHHSAQPRAKEEVEGETNPSSTHCLVLQWIQVPASVPEAFRDEFCTAST